MPRRRRGLFTRLYYQVYLTIVASLVLVALVSLGMWRLVDVDDRDGSWLETAAELVSAALPPPTASPSDQQQAVEALSQRIRMDLALFDLRGAPLAAAGRALPSPRVERRESGWQRGAHGPAWALHLPDGRWMVAGLPERRRFPSLDIVLLISGVAVAVALAALPIARRITRRLERLQSGVERLGGGDLSARVPVEGRDEVARLAESFNRAAVRIEELMAAHRLLLANASHELRTPLARIRMALELLKVDLDPARRSGVEADIAELDRLIDEILLSSRLDAETGMAAPEEVDLLALVAEEAIRYPAIGVEGEALAIEGDPHLLRRLIRNLIDNALRHGAPPVTVEVYGRGGGTTIAVCDGGPEIPPADRDRIFVPFRRGRGAATGYGLGLNLVRQIARHHGGTVDYAFVDGRSCFRVTFPDRPTLPA